ncbi:DDE superfamily endonuclease [Pyrenophora tritici-repentis]|nr:DDE superfamily endonuclease [Pyrenophora tritici-repentis]
MDPASRALVQTLPAGVPDTYAARSEHSNVPVSTLVHRRNGRRSREEQAQRQQYLTREEEKALVKFLLLMSNLSHLVRIKFIRLLACSIARQRSTKTRPIKPPGKNWPKAFAKRHENNDPAVLPENVYNMDETGVMLSMLGWVKVLVASTHRSNWTTYPTPGWHYGFSKNGYNDSKINLEWLTRVFDPQTRARANGKPHMLICDGFGTHETLEILEFCLTDNIILCRLPSHTSHKLQPCDVGPFAPLKTAYGDQVEQLNRGGIDIVGKGHFTYLYSPARDTALTKRNIRAGWAATGLYPFNPERVLKDIPRPPVEVVIPGAAIIDTITPDVMLQTPITPVTPVTAEALTSLHNVIKQDTSVPDETRSCIQKLANATQISFVERALLKDHNRFLFKISNEAKAYRSTRSIVLGKAKVRSFKDLEEAKVRRAEKDKAAAQKRQRGRKRKEPASEAPTSLSKAVRTGGVMALDNSPATSWTIPVARMY